MFENIIEVYSVQSVSLASWKVYMESRLVHTHAMIFFEDHRGGIRKIITHNVHQVCVHQQSNP